MAVITADNARELAARSWEARRAKAKAKEQAEAEARVRLSMAPQIPAPAPQPVDPIAARLLHTLQAKLDLLDSTNDPKAISALCRGIRELRETWHMVTGQPRPGLSKDGPGRPQRAVQVNPLRPARPDDPAELL